MKTQNSSLRIRTITGVTADLLAFSKAYPERYPFLLESVAKTKAFSSQEDASNTQTRSKTRTLGRYDVLMAFPQERIELHSLNEADTFLADARAAFAQNHSINRENPAVPFTGGWFAYFSYDYAQVVEPSLSLPMTNAHNNPLASLVRIPAAIIQDHQEQVVHLICEAEYDGLFDQLDQDWQALQAHSISPSPIHGITQIEEASQRFLDGVGAIKDYILQGDVFQVNLSREWQVPLEKTSALNVYASLRASNPAPFAAYADFGNWQILSSSPERLVRYESPWVETRPIAGTRRRSGDEAADKALMDELIRHPKEIAEHIMLIDLERNDLGRISQPGSVEVDELMVIESYEHVHHIVSNVRGKLKPDLDPLAIVHAVFPGGTITGCPKVRCMEIIAELEQAPRGLYTGSLGYINRDGSLDLNILIRSMRFANSSVTFRAGAGIVADSEPERELEETRHKAKGLINALVDTAIGNG